MSDISQSQVHDIVSVALEVVGQDERSGLAGETAEQRRSRILAVEPQGGGWIARIASDRLVLTEKSFIESALQSALGERLGTHVPVVIYFKRTAPQGGVGRGPAPLGRKAQPFGLNVEKRAIPGVAEVIVVASGKGGVGKSTVSTNLAVALACQGKKVGLLDADIYGPSVPLMLGTSGAMDVVGGNRLVPLEGHGVKMVSFGFLTDTRHPVIWRGPMVAKALRQLCYDVEWGELDYLVVDLPPGTGDVQLALIESLPLHGALIVTTPQNVALLDAHKALTMFEKLDVPVLGVIENMSYYCCPSCGHEEAIFGREGAERMAAERQVGILGRIPLNGEIRARADRGDPVALDGDSGLGRPFRDLAKRIIGPFG